MNEPTLHRDHLVWHQGLDDRFWEADKAGKEALLHEVLIAANADPDRFRKYWAEVELDPASAPWSVVLEALSKDLDQWGDFYSEQLDRVLTAAESVADPTGMLNLLAEYCYVEADHRPFIQRIVDRLVDGLGSRNWAVRAACVSMLTYYVDNPVVKDKEQTISMMRRRLMDIDLRVRYLAHQALHYEGLLPAGFKLSLKDRLLLLFIGKPSSIV